MGGGETPSFINHVNGQAICMIYELDGFLGLA